MADILEEQVKRALADFDGIEAALVRNGIAVPAGTDTSEYAALVDLLAKGLRDALVKSVNGVTPDANGNVDIETITEEQLTEAINSALKNVNVNDLVQTEGDVVILNCGNSAC